MNAVGIALVWCVVQVTLIGLWSGALSLIVRRFRPAAAASVALTGLLTVVLLSALALAPWPRWQLAGVEPQPDDRLPPRADASISGSEESPDESPDRIAGEVTAGNRLLRAAWWWQSFLAELSRAEPSVAETSWGWPATAAALGLTCTGAGAGWLLLGLLAVRRQRARSRPVEDPALLDLIATLRAELGCRRPIEVRQSNDLATAATIGWRRPVILLPPEWTAWTAEHRRAVLAHEIAHVRRNDFLAMMCGQLGLVLHFYHPLLHWLMGRLRLEQELAADADAASVSGGPHEYLMTIADLALNQEARPTLWPARSFLPTQTTFLRRIAMLRNSKLRFDRLSPAARTLSVGAVLVCGLLVAGFRGPTVRQETLAQEAAHGAAEAQSAAGTRELKGIDLTHVPQSAVAIMAFRPAAVIRQAGLTEYGRLLQDQPFPEELRPFGEIEQVTYVMLGAAEKRPPALTDVLIVYQRLKPVDLQAALRRMPKAIKKEHQGNAYYVETRGSPTRVSFVKVVAQLDDHALVETYSEETLKKLLSGRKGLPGFIDAKAWKAFEQDHALVAAESSALAQIARTIRPPPAATLLSTFSPLWDDTTWAMGGTRVGERWQVHAIAVAAREDRLHNIAKTVDALHTLANNAMGEARAAAKRERMTAPEALHAWVLDAIVPVLADIRVRSEGRAVRVDGSASMDALRKLLPSIRAIQRSQSMTNLKQIGLAMHSYYQVYKQFPPAVLYGPDGKTPYSWRVALLPFLEQEALYKHYRFDEPWDGPNNRRLAETRVRVYQYPGEAARSANASYFALVGPGTVFEEKKEGTRFQDIRDGSSNTILFVEAKRNIPWTKPEDIPYDPNKPIPELGGCCEGSFLAVFTDGHVQAIPQNIGETVLRAMITRAGGENVQKLVQESAK